MFNTLHAHGFDPRTTPVDVLRSAPLSTHLAVADALGDDGDGTDDDLAGMTVHDDWEYA